jgi:hypothetical protein
MAVSGDKKYEYLTSQCRYLDQKISDTFNLFIKLLITVTGGVFFLEWKLPLNDPARSQFGLAANALMIMLCISLVVSIFNLLRSWSGNRKAISELVPDIPPPPKFYWYTTEVVFCFLIIAFCVSFVFLNPLSKTKGKIIGTQKEITQKVSPANK